MTLQWSSNGGAPHTSQGSPWGSEGAGGIVWTRAAIRLPNAGRRPEDSRLLLDPSRGPTPPGEGAAAARARPPGATPPTSPSGRQTVNRGPSSQAAALGSRETAASQN